LSAITGVAGPTKAMRMLENMRNTRNELVTRRFDMFYRIRIRI
jgi:hypothetical protein